MQEIADMYNVFGCYVRKAVKAVFKDGILKEQGVRRHVWKNDRISYDHSLESKPPPSISTLVKRKSISLQSSTAEFNILASLSQLPSSAELQLIVEVANSLVIIYRTTFRFPVHTLLPIKLILSLKFFTISKIGRASCRERV